MNLGERGNEEEDKARMMNCLKQNKSDDNDGKNIEKTKK